MLSVFGILILLLGVAAMFVLRLRAASPRTASGIGEEASSFQNRDVPGTDDALQWLRWKLSLTQAQQEEVRPVVEREILERSALLETPAVSSSEQQAQLVELRNRALEEIRPVLTNRQQSLLHALEQEGHS